METVETKKASALNIGAKFGLILGLCSITVSLLLYAIGFDTIKYSWVLNIINGALVIAMVVLAHQSYKESGNGYMSYGQGLGIGMITVLVSMAISGVYTYVFFNFIDPSMFQAIFDKVESDMEAQGQSEQAIEMALGFTRKFFWAFFVVGALFWGFLIGVIVSIFTQKREPETAF
jgi:hypothetical protein